MDELKEYQIQQQKLDEAIKLQNELQALLDLQQVSENNSSSSNGQSATTNSKDALDDEMALFMAEMKEIDKCKEPNERLCQLSENDDNLELHIEAMENELQSMIGNKCSAPHQHSWGTTTYHNAIICGLDNTNDYKLDKLDDFRVQILFTNPTHREMIPCSYFLNGECRFDASKCRFSHGEMVVFSELKEYKEPDFEKLQKNCIVLAKMKDSLWHKGRVISVDSEEKSCRVKLENDKKEIDCPFEDLFPIFHDDDLSSSSSFSDSEDSDTNYMDEMRQSQLIEQSLLNPAPDQALGEWEKYTRGIGSKLMQKMGYVIGTGLGTNGEGIIIPISAQVLPQGRSLDHCMELREAANGDENLFSVERKMKKAQRKQEALTARIYQEETNRTDLFSFLNDNIFPGTSASTSTSQTNVKTKMKPTDYKNHTTKTLNVETVKISDDIKKIEKEIIQVKERLNRQSQGSELRKILQKTLDSKNNELNNLKRTENSIMKEQMSRKHKTKMSIF